MKPTVEKFAQHLISHANAARAMKIFSTEFSIKLKYLSEEETINLKGLLRHYNSEAAEIYRRQQINLNSSVHFSHRVNIESNSCDVITVASNEGP